MDKHRALAPCLFLLSQSAPSLPIVLSLAYKQLNPFARKFLRTDLQTKRKGNTFHYSYQIHPGNARPKYHSNLINAYALHPCPLPFAAKKKRSAHYSNLRCCARVISTTMRTLAWTHRSNMLSSSCYQFLPFLPPTAKNFNTDAAYALQPSTNFSRSSTFTLFYNLYSSLSAIAFVSSTNSATPSSSGRCAANGSPSPTAGKADRKLLRSVLRR